MSYTGSWTLIPAIPVGSSVTVPIQAVAAAGAGLAAAGGVFAGIGSNATGAAVGTAVIPDARYINPLERDFVVDSAGNYLPLTVAQQIVQIALLTTEGSSAVPRVGLGALPAVLNDQTIASIRDSVSRALADAVTAKLIEVVSIDVAKRLPNRADLRVRFRDLTAQNPGTEAVFTVPLNG